MTIYRATAFDTPGSVAGPARLRAAHDLALVVQDGTIVARTGFSEAVLEHPDHDVVDLRDGVLLPGLIDTHVHFPQARIIGGLGMPLLEWLERRALPEEVCLAESTYARGVADDFLAGLRSAGTTTALVFGSHFAAAMDVFFEAAGASGLRITSGLTVSDRVLPDPLLVDPATALAQGRRLADRWHGSGRLRYAVTPRFSLSASDAMLESCAELLHGHSSLSPGQSPGLSGQGATAGASADPLWFTTHVNENPAEIEEVARLFPDSRDYLDTYERHGLVTPQAVLAHNVHPTADELPRLAAAGAAVAHCPTSNFALGSGLFPFREHREAGVHVALGSDVGGGTGFCLLKEGLQGSFGQRLRGPEGLPLTPADLLRLATLDGAAALGLDATVGDLSVGKEFDAVLVSPAAGGALAGLLPYALDDEDALAKIFTAGGPSDVSRVWVSGAEVGGQEASGEPALQASNRRSPFA